MPEPENRAELLLTLKACEEEQTVDRETAHQVADAALLAYIDDDEITKAFQRIHKWYA